MKASIIQSLMSRVRVDIRISEEFSANYKAIADEYFEGGDGTLGEAYRMVKYYRQEKKEIAKLVAIQKELKKALQVAYVIENTPRTRLWINDVEVL